jgi:hypothetical protein
MLVSCLPNINRIHLSKTLRELRRIDHAARESAAVRRAS